MAVHIHSFEGPGAYYETAGADPLLLGVWEAPRLEDASLGIRGGMTRLSAIR
ncbi:hypothetical protein [Corallococcus sp. AB011P]|uniref:hypothetical protein n=1 Tax=Corallococcus sp. AB011P TaxID=2316735 RepID=UPI00131592F0|nr:hypothetical protein [Corallococcus sp. AB011P]